MADNKETTVVASLEEQLFEQVFKTNFKSLYAYAYTIVKDESTAKEIVQQVFFNIWKKKDKLLSASRLIHYLFTSVYNASLNHLEHQKVRSLYKKNYMHLAEKATPAVERIQQKEIEQRIAEAYNELPEKSRLIFQMSRYEGLKYAEISRKLQVSEKAVEKHMTRALKIFRVKLKEFLP